MKLDNLRRWIKGLPSIEEENEARHNAEHHKFHNELRAEWNVGKHDKFYKEGHAACYICHKHLNDSTIGFRRF